MAKNKGLFFIIVGGILWGASGTCAQILLHDTGLSTYWLTGMRLLCAGILLLIYSYLHTHQNIFTIWRSPKMASQLLIFSFIGMLPSQLAYFMAIKYGNAATGTILQFLGPIFILLFLTIRWRLKPSRTDILSVLLAFLGTFLLVTQGNITQLALSISAIVWGILSGLSQAFYTLLPGKLLKSYATELITGWAMLLGSIPFLPLLTSHAMPTFSLNSWLEIIFIIVFGTAIAYLFYLSSLNYLKPTTSSMLSAFEPLTATFLAVVFLGTPFSLVQILGGVLIIGVTFLQALSARKPINDHS